MKATSNVELLPLPGPDVGVLGPIAFIRSDKLLQEWCRANVEANTEALRAEVDGLRRERAALLDKLNGTPCAEVRWRQELERWKSSYNAAIELKGRAFAESNRLAEALRVIAGYTGLEFPDAADMAGACVETAHNALRPTAAQGGGEAEKVCHDCRLSTTGFCHHCAVKEDPATLTAALAQQPAASQFLDAAIKEVLDNERDDEAFEYAQFIANEIRKRLVR